MPQLVGRHRPALAGLEPSTSEEAPLSTSRQHSHHDVEVGNWAIWDARGHGANPWGAARMRFRLKIAVFLPMQYSTAQAFFTMNISRETHDCLRYRAIRSPSERPSFSELIPCIVSLGP
jgi:hypothetical protein